MNCGMGVGSRPNGQHGGSRHGFSLCRVVRAKGSAKNCVANFALDRRRIGASRSRQIDAVRNEKVLSWQRLDGQEQVGKRRQVARFRRAACAM